MVSMISVVFVIAMTQRKTKKMKWNEIEKEEETADGPPQKFDNQPVGVKLFWYFQSVWADSLFQELTMTPSTGWAICGYSKARGTTLVVSNI